MSQKCDATLSFQASLLDGRFPRAAPRRDLARRLLDALDTCWQATSHDLAAIAYGGRSAAQWRRSTRHYEPTVGQVQNCRRAIRRLRAAGQVVIVGHRRKYRLLALAGNLPRLMIEVS